MTTQHHSRIVGLGVAVALAAAASACSSSDPVESDTALFAPRESTVATEPAPTTGPPPPPTEEPASANGFDMVEVTIEELGVTTVVPRGWTRQPEGGFGDGVSQVAVVAFPTSIATDPTLEDFEPAGHRVVDGRRWNLYRMDAGDTVVGAALTEIGDFTYAVVLDTPASLAESSFETVAVPALEAFEAAGIPDADRWFKGIDVTSIEVDGRSVAYATGGAGVATVVFEAGLGNGMESWALVASGAAEVAKVFAYDRPGYGGSDLTDNPRDGATIVAELRELLSATGQEPPYILVGHSLGGMFMDLFARTHPDEVAGVVLVDSRHHDFGARCLERLGAAQCNEPSDADVAAVPEPTRGEWLGTDTTVAELGDAPDFPQVPLRVIVAGLTEAPSGYDEIWRETQQDYADMASDSQLLIAEHSNHGIPAQQPEIIVDAITDVVQHTAPVQHGELDGVLGELIVGTRLPAIGATIFDDQHIVETGVTGVRRVGDATAVEVNDQFSIGSNAKAMTATLVATFVDDGLIGWDTTVGDVFGGTLPTIEPSWASITFRQFLSHTSGVDDAVVFAQLVSVDLSTSVTSQRASAVALATTMPTTGTAGEYAYSNVGYTVAAAMLEELTGDSWEHLVQTRLFDELGMPSCGFYAPGTPGEVDQPWGHLDELDGMPMDPGDPEADLPPVLAPTGMIHCNMADWVRFLQSQLRGFQGSATEVVSAESYDAIQTPPAGSDYALGWVRIVDPAGTVTFYNHGSNDRFTAEAWLVPSENSGLITVTNIGDTIADPHLQKVNTAMLNRRTTS